MSDDFDSKSNNDHDNDATEADHPSMLLHPNRFQRRIPPSVHEVVPAGGIPSRPVSQSRRANDVRPARRTMRIERDDYPLHTSTSTTSTANTTPISLADFELHSNDLPERISEDDLARLLGELETTVLTFTQAQTVPDMLDKWMEVRNRVYQLPSSQNTPQYRPTTLDVNIEYERLQLLVTRLRLKFQEMQVIQQQSAVTESQTSHIYVSKFARILNVLYNVRTILFSYAQNQLIADPAKPYTIGQYPDEINPGYFTYLRTAKLKSHQKFLLYVMDMASQKQFRKLWGEYPGLGDTVCMYEQIRTPDGHATHAWRKTTCIDKFIHSLTDIDNNFEQWTQATKSGNVLTFIKQHLRESDDTRFPKLKRQRHVFAFLNGIYDAEEIRFYTYDHPLPSTLVAAKYFEQNFDTSILDAKYVDDPMSIPTPALDKIMDDQGIPKDAHLMVKALIGRLFHKLNKYEKWRVALFILGLPGTGKSTIGTFIMNLYERENVGIISSDMEKQFGVSAFAEAFLAICPEVSEKFNLTHTMLQSMIDGEYVSYARKYLTATTVAWSTLLLLMGNVVPPNWNEYGGNVVRRIVCLMFNKPIANMDADLETQLYNILPNVIHACNMCYRRMATEWNKKTFWNDETPAYFTETKEKLSIMISPIQSFIQISGHVEVTNNMNDSVAFNDFIQALNQFCNARGYQTKRWTETLCRPTFLRFGLQSIGQRLHNIKFTDAWTMQQLNSGRSRPSYAPGGVHVVDD